MYENPFMVCGMMSNMEMLQRSLQLVKEAVQGEQNDELFYDYLISIAPTQEEKDIISSIRDDERKHNKMFRRIYMDLTGMEIAPGVEETFEKPDSYLDGIRNALFGELATVEKYRKIREGLPNRYYRDMLFEIITDELKHSAKYNYILSKDIRKTTPSMKGSNYMDTSNFTPDQWIEYIDPVVKRAMAEKKEGINLEHLFQEFILTGVLVGLGNKPTDAIEQVEKWEKTGESKLLKKSKGKK